MYIVTNESTNSKFKDKIKFEIVDKKIAINLCNELYEEYKKSNINMILSYVVIYNNQVIYRAGSI
jgi:hypothetical protein